LVQKAGQHDKYLINLKIAQARTGQNMNLMPAWRASARIRGIGKKHENRVAAEGRDMGGTGVITDGERSRASKIDQGRKFGPTDEIDRSGASRVDFCGERFFIGAADDDWKDPGRLEELLRERAIAPRRPALGRMTQRRAGDQYKESAVFQPGR